MIISLPLSLSLARGDAIAARLTRRDGAGRLEFCDYRVTGEGDGVGIRLCIGFYNLAQVWKSLFCIDDILRPI